MVFSIFKIALGLIVALFLLAMVNLFIIGICVAVKAAWPRLGNEIHPQDVSHCPRDGAASRQSKQMPLKRKSHFRSVHTFAV